MKIWSRPKLTIAKIDKDSIKSKRDINLLPPLRSFLFYFFNIINGCLLVSIK